MLSVVTAAPSGAATSGPGTSTLLQGQALNANQTLVSPNHGFYLIMQSDGNLVLYNAYRALWQSNTHFPPAYSILQGDGNFVIYGVSASHFATGTSGPDFLTLQSDGNLVIYGPSGPLWSTNTVQPSPVALGATTIGPNQELATGQSLTSAFGRFTLIMQNDGNLVLYEHSLVLFSTNTFASNTSLVMQPDGDLVVMAGNGAVLWTSRSYGPGSVAILQGDGNFVVYYGRVPTFNTFTNQPASGVGVYGFGVGGTTAGVQTAIADGWPVIGDVGALGTRTAPYTAELAGPPDLIVANALRASGASTTWLSFWTVSGPAAGDSWSNAGVLAGRLAATTLDNYNARPAFVVLDPEGFNGDSSTPCSSGADGSPGTPANWSSFLYGWATGIRSVNGHLTPAFYSNQCQYRTGNLASITLPAFPAVAPVLFSDGSANHPIVSGGNIEGFITYYGGCPAPPYESAVASWGEPYNTLEFADSGVDCAP